MDGPSRDHADRCRKPSPQIFTSSTHPLQTPSSSSSSSSIITTSAASSHHPQLLHRQSTCGRHQLYRLLLVAYGRRKTLGDGFSAYSLWRRRAHALTKYSLLLKELAKHNNDNIIIQDLAIGIEVAENISREANQAIDRSLLDEASEELVVRVDDWKDHNVQDFKRLLLHGSHKVVGLQRL
ncbi:hypothetical protein FJTKL_07375 [Diaporthe vaccinii]|uniref:Uncharacterized protein n=1 Tax=Diaporthe vaccinii TaxID=105482 RepID=A0ABR4DPI9_9PEZI